MGILIRLILLRRFGPGAPPTLPLDLIAQSPTAAFSTRKTRAGYAGQCMRVRRASDNTLQDFGFVSNLLDVASLETFCAGTDGFIERWYDQGTGGRNVAQTTAANQPQIVSTGTCITTVNGKPSPKFSATQYFAAESTWTAVSNYITAGAFTVQALARPASGSSTAGGLYYTQSGFWGDDSGWVGAGFSANPSDRITAGHGNPAVLAALSVTYPSTNVMIHRFTGSAVDLWVNGGASNNAVGGNISVVSGTLLIGKLYNTAGMDGHMPEIILFNNSQALSDLNLVAGSQASWGGTSWTTAT